MARLGPPAEQYEISNVARPVQVSCNLKYWGLRPAVGLGAFHPAGHAVAEQSSIVVIGAVEGRGALEAERRGCRPACLGPSSRDCVSRTELSLGRWAAGSLDVWRRYGEALHVRRRGLAEL
jgi:hypothetical protein